MITQMSALFSTIYITALLLLGSCSFLNDSFVGNQGPGKGTLFSITISPSNASISTGSTVPFSARAFYNDGKIQDITARVSWSSTTSSVATINGKGLATGKVAGTSHVSIAPYSGVSASNSPILTVVPARQLTEHPPTHNEK
jgi:trimeric autotransporter adhesin